MLQEGLHVQPSVCESRSFCCGDVSVFWSVSVSKCNGLVFIDVLYDGWIADLTGAFCVFVKLHRAQHRKAPILIRSPKTSLPFSCSWLLPPLFLPMCTLTSD